ncbi:MAG: hypothetical protein AAFO69_19760 [Bacteroidota bacterium]
MKKLMMVVGLIMAFQVTAFSQSKLALGPNQSMCISGKGDGQDGAINPYLGQKSIAVVKNISNAAFDVRIQDGNEIIKIVALDPKEKKEFLLEKNYILLFDTDEASAAKVAFKAFEDGRK